MPFSFTDYESGEKIIFEKSQARVARSPYRITIPKDYNSDLAYLAGYHLGDGYLYSTKSQKEKASYEILYADEHRNQIEGVISQILQKNFGVPLRIYKRNNNLWIGRINCKILHIFFNQILGMPAGKKGTFSIPKWIFLDKSYLRLFISGFFDAEGSIFISKPSKVSITLTNTNYRILSEIRNALWYEFGIIFGKIYKKHNVKPAFEMKTGAKDVIIRFCKDIGFRHPNKIDKMTACLERLQQIHSRPRKVAHPPVEDINALPLAG